MDFIAAVDRDGRGVLELCSTGPERPIPSCPEWTAADLQQHILDTFEGAIPGFSDVPADAPAEPVTRAVQLLAVDPAPARDVAHECAVHRWDASMAFGADYAVEPELACDGVEEFFDAAWPMWLDYFKRPAGTGETIHLHRTDGPGDWLIALEHRPRVSHGGAGGDVEVRGTASELVLWLWGRMDPPEVVGDRAVLEGIRNPHGRFLSPGF